jgi:hypothetical protein
MYAFSCAAGFSGLQPAGEGCSQTGTAARPCANLALCSPASWFGDENSRKTGAFNTLAAKNPRKSGKFVQLRH